MNGDRRVDISDVGFFSLAHLQAPNYNAALDFNNDGRIDISDFGPFSVRFFTTLPRLSAADRPACCRGWALTTKPTI